MGKEKQELDKEKALRIAHAVKKAREQYGLTLDEFGKFFGTSGVSGQAVSGWEKAKSIPRAENLLILADLLNENIEQFVEWINLGKTTKSDTTFENKSTEKTISDYLLVSEKLRRMRTEDLWLLQEELTGILKERTLICK